MKISEAIRLKELEGDEFLNADPDDLDEADRLSIEALKEVDALRKVLKGLGNSLLPGEAGEPPRG